MDNLVKLLSDIPGAIIDVGYGNGSFSKLFHKLDVQKRSYYVFDKFDVRPIGPAIDFVNSNLSSTQLDSQAFDTIDLDEILLWVSSASLIRISHDDYHYSYRLIESIWPNLNYGGIILVDNLSSQVALKRFARDKEGFQSAVVDSNDFSYLIKKRVNTTFDKKVTRSWSSTLT